MIKKSKHLVLIIIAFVSFAVGCVRGDKATATLEPMPYYDRVSKQLAIMLPRDHLLQLPLNDELSARAWTNFISILDYDHTYFLASDISQFEESRFKLDDDLKQGDLTFAYHVFEVFKTRLNERYTFVTNLLAKSFDFTLDENYEWQRKDAPWPADRKAQDELWRLKIKNEYLAFVISRETEKTENKEIDKSGNNSAIPETKEDENKSADNPVEQNSDKMPSESNKTPPVTPAEFVRKRHEQFRMVMNDSDSEWVLQRYLAAVTSAYDPHSEYMSPARVEDFNIDMNLSLYGIGAILRPEDGAAKIVELIPGGPAARDTREARLKPGDKIVGVGQDNGPVEDILHLPLNKTVQKIRGKKGTRVVLSVVSSTDMVGASTRLVDLIRDEVKLEEQAATGRVERVSYNGTEMLLGVVRLPAFYGTMQQRPGSPGFRSATYDVQRELVKLNTQGVQGLILDLRGNGGGSLREAVLLTGLFIRRGPVVQVRETNQLMVLPVPDQDPMVAFRKPMVVLVNRMSASASEIVAGALQDYERAIIIGDSKTHGKGSVQTVLNMGKEEYGKLKVTTANYYRVSGSSTQLRGVVPDIVIPSVYDAIDSGEDKLPNPLPWTQVEPAVYSRIFNLQPVIPELRARSSQRLAVNTQYGRLCRMVQHLTEMNKTTTVPLEIDARRALAKAEKEMRRLQDDEEEKSAKSESVKDDVILNEALQILSDLISMTGGQEMPLTTPEDDLRIKLMKIFGIGVAP